MPPNSLEHTLATYLIYSSLDVSQKTCKPGSKVVQGSLSGRFHLGIHYLRGVLRGAASVATSGISLTEENYAVALKLLQEKFGSKESIVEMLYVRLQSLPTSSSKFSDIQYTHNNVERILRQLESQGETVDNQRTLVYQILSKFPLEVILKLESSKQCDIKNGL